MPTGEPAWRLPIPDAGLRRRLARFHAARMFVAAEQGNWTAFADAYECGLVLAKISTWRAAFLEQLVGSEILNLMDTELRRALAERTLDLETIESLQRIRKEQAPQINFTLAVEAERRGMLDAVQRVFTDDGRGDGLLLLRQLNDIRETPKSYLGLSGEDVKFVNVASLFMRRRAETTLRVNQLHDRLSSFVDQTPALREPFALAEASACCDVFGKYYPVIDALRPHWAKAVRAVDGARIQWAGTAVMLEIARVHAATGSWPSDLRELSAVDFMDPLSGLPFRYTLRDPAAAAAQHAYLFYSVGLDGIDDGGFMRPGREADALMFGGISGVDFLFNAPRPSPE